MLGLVTGAVLIALGVLASASSIVATSALTRLSHSPQAVRRGELVRLSMVPYQVTLGYVAIALGIWTIVAAFLYRIA